MNTTEPGEPPRDHRADQVQNRNPQSSIVDAQASIPNPQSQILNPQSSILDPRSSILVPQSAIGSSVRTLIFQHLAGIVLAPVIKALADRGVFAQLYDAPVGIS